MNNEIKMPNGKILDAKPLILETRASGNRVSQTLLRKDGKIQRRESIARGPATLSIGDVTTSWNSLVTDTLFTPEPE